MAEGVRWLTDDEQRAWRAFLLARQLLEDALDRQLQRDSGMPSAYFKILTVLIEAGPCGLRMRDLAAELRYSPSRLAHAVSSLESSGWVARQRSDADGRGQVATLTESGADAQRAAAVGHVAEVRKRIFDRIDPDRVEQLEALSRVIIESFDCSGDTDS